MSEQNNSGGKIEWSQQNIIIMVLLGVVIVLLAANLFKAPAVQVVETNTEAEGEGSKRKNDRGREEDPYIANQVKNTIVKGYVQIRDCYNAFIDKKPAVTDGKVMIDWNILESGKVEKVELVSSEIPDEELTNCIISKIKDFRFPPPPSGRSKYVAHKFFLKKDTGEANK
ncbi:MAG: AgmX/PglI C-terminal domain-containing protein [Bdellovibrionales bacterium]